MHYMVSKRFRSSCGQEMYDCVQDVHGFVEYGTIWFFSFFFFISLFFLFTLILSVFPGALHKERERERQDKLCLYIILK